MKVRVLCVNDANKPNEIPQSKWIVKDKEYHITWIYNQLQQKGIKGVELAEFDISDCIPYNCYRLDRFAIHVEDLEILMQMFKDATELNDIEIKNLIPEETYQDFKV